MNQDLLVAELHVALVAGTPLSPVCHFAWNFILHITTVIGPFALFELAQGSNASCSATMRMFIDGPIAMMPPLSTRHAAGTPLVPWREFTRFWSRLMAANGLRELSKAGLTTMLRCQLYVSGAVLLPIGLSRVTTCTPLRPLRDFAITRLHAICLAPLGLCEGTIAGWATFVVHILDDARARAQAYTCGLLPICPGPKQTRNGNAIPAVVINRALRLIHLCTSTLFPSGYLKQHLATIWYSLVKTQTS